MLTRSARKRQTEGMMRDVESEMELNMNKNVSGAPITATEPEGALVKSTIEEVSSVPVTATEPEGAPVKSTVEEVSGAPITATEPKGVPVKQAVKGTSQGGDVDPSGAYVNI